MLHFLNYFFFVFHTAFTLFNMFGWIWKKTRKWNLITLIITAGSWFILGIWYGWGYCLCTDWHWDVREQLGYHDQKRNYIHFLLLKLTGINFDEQLVDRAITIGFIISVAGSLSLNLRDYLSKRKKNKPNSL